MNNEKFLEERRRIIGGTDAAAITGMNPFKTVYDVYLEKRGLTDPSEQTEAMKWGLLLEEPILREYQKQTGYKVRKGGQLKLHSQHKFLGAHVDGFIDGNGDRGRGILEVKTSSPYMLDEWGDPGTDEVPKGYLIQCMHYLGIYDYDWADIAVLIGGRDFRIYHLQRDPELIDWLFTAERYFWHDHILAEIPPPTDSSDSCKRALARMFPEDTGESVEMTPEMANRIRLHIERKEELKTWAEVLQGYDNEIKAYMGDATIMAGDGLKVTWRKTKDREKTDWMAVAGEMIAKSDISRETFHAIVETYTQTTPGHRQFLVKPIKEK